MAGTETDPTPKVDPKDPPAPDPKPKDPPAPDPDDDDDGTDEDPVAAAKKWKALARKHEKAERAAQAELDKVKAANMTEAEKAIEKAKAEGRAEATAELTRSLVESAIETAATGTLADPEDATRFLGDLDRFATGGKVDKSAISAAIAKLVKDRPYLAASGKASPLPGGGGKPTTGTSFTDDIRARAARG